MRSDKPDMASLAVRCCRLSAVRLKPSIGNRPGANRYSYASAPTVADTRNGQIDKFVIGKEVSGDCRAQQILRGTDPLSLGPETQKVWWLREYVKFSINLIEEEMAYARERPQIFESNARRKIPTGPTLLLAALECPQGKAFQKAKDPRLALLALLRSNGNSSRATG